MCDGHFEDSRVAAMLYSGSSLLYLKKEWIEVEWQWRNMITQPWERKIQL